MAKLIFQADAVRRVVEHSIANAQSEVPDWSTANKANDFTPVRAVPAEATIILVHDQGVYLMSNGKPRDQREGANVPRSFVAYAKGCDPEKDEDWWGEARELVGGDDFAEYLPWAREIKKLLDNGATQIVVGFSQHKLSLSAKYQKAA